MNAYRVDKDRGEDVDKIGGCPRVLVVEQQGARHGINVWPPRQNIHASSPVPATTSLAFNRQPRLVAPLPPPSERSILFHRAFSVTANGLTVRSSRAESLIIDGCFYSSTHRSLRDKFDFFFLLRSFIFGTLGGEIWFRLGKNANQVSDVNRYKVTFVNGTLDISGLVEKLAAPLIRDGENSFDLYLIIQIQSRHIVLLSLIISGRYRSGYTHGENIWR